jgi:hypothetical protein
MCACGLGVRSNGSVLNSIRRCVRFSASRIGLERALGSRAYSAQLSYLPAKQKHHEQYQQQWSAVCIGG